MKSDPQPRVMVVEDAEALQALGHPLRLRILEALRQPASAAQVARATGQSRQNANYHLKALEAVRLVSRVGERRNGHVIETLYRAAAGSVLVSPRAAWADLRRLAALTDQVSLETLLLMGERLSRHAAALLDRAAFDGEQIASASVEAELHFPDEEARSAFLRDYVAAVGPLLTRHGAKEGSPYRVILAAYPDPEDLDLGHDDQAGER
jgi:DNA-binding transcriptional ArsR family regulator